MKKQHIMALAVAAAVSSTASIGFAATNPFTDVPADHWAYDAVNQLAKDGVIEGYGDGTFNGNKNITRYEMAQMVAKAMAKSSAKNVSSDDKVLIDKLSAEFGDELNSLGVRVANLEKNSDNVKWSGSFAQKYMRDYHKGPKNNEGPWWEKEFDLNATATVPGSGWQVHGNFVNKWGTDQGNGFNDEKSFDDAYNGGYKRSNDFHLDKIWVEGNLGKTGQYVKFGDFQPWTMNGFINDANIKGASFEHWGKNYATHIFGGRMDVKDWDMAVDADVDWSSKQWVDWQTYDTTNNVYIADQTYKTYSYNPYTDFVRYHSSQPIHVLQSVPNGTDWTNTTLVSKGNAGGDNLTNPNSGNVDKTQRKDLYGAVIDYTFNKKTNASLGYYRFRSAAYDHDWLNIVAGLVNYKLVRNLNLETMYAHGDQHGNNKAYNVELQFRGNPWIPADRAHLFGAYIGYRYLGPDAIVKTNFGDGAKAGQKGVEVGCFYNLMKNVQYSIKYFRGKSLTNHVHDNRSRFYTTLSWNF